MVIKGGKWLEIWTKLIYIYVCMICFAIYSELEFLKNLLKYLIRICYRNITSNWLDNKIILDFVLKYFEKCSY